MSIYPMITDMAGEAIQHSMVISNFIAMIKPQMKDSTCKVFGDNVLYKWKTDDKEYSVMPDSSINCRCKSSQRNFFFDAPRFVMEVLSKSTEHYDHNEKMEIYRMMEVEEYWLVNWENKTIEIYCIDWEPDNVPRYYQQETIIEENKQKLKLYTFPHVKVDFDELFDVAL